MNTTAAPKSIHTGNCEKCGAWSTDLHRKQTLNTRTGRFVFTGGFKCEACR